MRSSVACFTVVALLVSAATAFGFAGVGRSKWEGIPPSGEVSVTVEFPEGSPAKGINVVVGGKVLKTDEKGSVRVPGGIPAATGVVAAEAVRGEGGFLGLFRNKVRYMAIRQVEPKQSEPLNLQVKLASVGDADPLCRSCHPDKATSVAPVVRCIHKSGVPVKAAQVARVKAFNRENEALLKAGKPALPPIRLGERPDNKGIFKSKVAVLACLTCHTNHVETGIRKYVLMPFDDPSTLCKGCHV